MRRRLPRRPARCVHRVLGGIERALVVSPQVLPQPSRGCASFRLGVGGCGGGANRLRYALHRRPRRAVRRRRRAFHRIHRRRPSPRDPARSGRVDGDAGGGDVAAQPREVRTQLANLPFPLRPRPRAHLVQPPRRPRAALYLGVVHARRLRHGEQRRAVELVVEVPRELLLGVNRAVEHFQRPLPLRDSLLDHRRSLVRDPRALHVRAPAVPPRVLELALKVFPVREHRRERAFKPRLSPLRFFRVRPVLLSVLGSDLRQRLPEPRSLHLGLADGLVERFLHRRLDRGV